MNKTLKVILLTFFIVLTYQKVSQEGVVNKIDKSVIIDIKATTKIIKSSIKIIKVTKSAGGIFSDHFHNIFCFL